MALSIGSNKASLVVQRMLANSEQGTNAAILRLSSGQRINRAGDDAAALSVADTLGTRRRVFTQAIRNLNDGISLVQIADAAIAELSSVVIRLQELAERSASSSLGRDQRAALNEEAQKLEQEFTRIKESTSFNGLLLLNGSVQTLSFEAGHGCRGAIESGLGGAKGTGQLRTGPAFPSSPAILGGDDLALGDLDRDGILDLALVDATGSKVVLYRGLGDGSFTARGQLNDIPDAAEIVLGDLNNDGALDAVIASRTQPEMFVYLGDTSGSFEFRFSHSEHVSAHSTILVDSLHGADLNDDGNLDIIAAAPNGPYLSFGNGDGTFQPAIGMLVSNILGITSGDFNEDGLLDVATTDLLSNDFLLYLNDGNEGFTPKAEIPFVFTTSMDSGDVNNDGHDDIVAAVIGGAIVMRGAGDGAFLAWQHYLSPVGNTDITLADMDGDGSLDIVLNRTILRNAGDGTFQERFDNPSFSGYSLAIGDLNQDGVLDLVQADTNGAIVLLGETEHGIGALLPFDLSSQAGSLQAMAPLRQKLQALANHRGELGALQGRLETGARALAAAVESSAAAEVRIRSADVAQESSELLLQTIKRATSAAVLAQANQQPALLVELLLA